jgi:3-deoxy-D-arabino-heptulosonate 7-phosphate (DAHP) synthase class II
VRDGLDRSRPIVQVDKVRQKLADVVEGKCFLLQGVS